MNINFNLFGFEVQIERKGWVICIDPVSEKNRHIYGRAIHHCMTYWGACSTARLLARRYAYHEGAQFIQIYREGSENSPNRKVDRYLLDTREVTKINRFLTKL